MSHARLKPNDFLALLGDKLLLRAHILVRLLLQEDLLQDIEETEWIEVKEIAEELLIG